jgi:hypothetical protein
MRPKFSSVTANERKRVRGTRAGAHARALARPGNALGEPSYREFGSTLMKRSRNISVV